MTKAGGGFWSRVATIAVVAAVIVVGDMRPVSSQAASHTVAVGASPRGDATKIGRVDADKESLDHGNMIPAIYAWDPDVRFVYLRHVSKWM